MRFVFLALAALLGAALPASAQTLRIAMKGAVENADPGVNYSPNRNVQLHVYETLVTQDSHLQAQPQLAVSWRVLDPTTWEFTLRDGVRFHTGAPFTADDAVFSIEHARDVKNTRTYIQFVRGITAAEAKDAHTLVLHTRAPLPELPAYLTNVAILSRAAATDATDADFNGGRAAIGTGPYRWIRWTPAQDVLLERNPNYWGGAQPWEKVIFRFVPNDSARVAGLLAGDVDVIDAVPSGLYERVRGGNNRLVTADSIFTHYMYVDSLSPRIVNATSADGQPLEKNPFRDLRVREALTHAVNRTALAERAMEGSAAPAGQIAAPGFYGHVPELKPPSYDPALSRKLLADAGYPKGFNLVIQCTNDRFAGDALICQSIGQMLTAIGIRTTVDAQPISVYLKRWMNFSVNEQSELSVHMSMFGSTSGLSSVALTTLVRTRDVALGRGVQNGRFYSDPKLDAMLTVMDSTFDDQKREQLTREAITYAMSQQAVIPLLFMKAAWGLRTGLTFEPRGDQYTMATTIRAQP